MSDKFIVIPYISIYEVVPILKMDIYNITIYTLKYVINVTTSYVHICYFHIYVHILFFEQSVRGSAGQIGAKILPLRQ